MQKLLSSEETLQIAFNKKAVNFDGDAVYSEKLNDYLNERSSIIEKYTSVEKNVYSTVAGYFYSGFDGFESLLSADASGMTVSQLDGILASEGETCPSDYVGKVQTTPYWVYAGKLKITPRAHTVGEKDDDETADSAAEPETAEPGESAQ